MKLIITKDYNQLSRRAANLIAAQVLVKPNSVLGLATGSSVIGTYENLIKFYNAGQLSFSHVKTANLDEYIGLEGTHPQSYNYYMHNVFFNNIDIPEENINLFKSDAPNELAECKRFDNVLAQLGNIDLQLLGVGTNGHIGFNEPSDYITNETFVTELMPSTITSNQRFFDDKNQMPTKAYTLSLGGILRAKKLLMVVTGENKAEILKKIIDSPITPHIPATLAKIHNDFTLIADEAAAKYL